MIDFPFLPQLVRSTDSKIVMLVLAGIGGAPDPLYGRSELDAARIPNLDNLSRQSAGGLSIPVAPGISPGGASGNLALLGYDPLKYVFSRGPLEALGTGIELRDGDVAARGNLAVVDDSGAVTDRRAGRLGTDEAAPLVERLREIKIRGVELEIGHGAGHRFALRMRGTGLSAAVSDTDPAATGVAPAQAEAEAPEAAKTAAAANEFVKKARAALEGTGPANTVLLRGWSGPPQLSDFSEAYRLNPAAITAYPMYRGLAKAVGMTLYPSEPDFRAHLSALKEHWEEHDFFWIHYKETDSAAEDGDFIAKKRAIEKLDEHVHDILGLKPDVLVIAGDHASPSQHNGHSWHPVPFMIRSGGTMGGSGIDRFNERDLRHGTLGQFEAKHAMMLILAHAGKLKQFGA